MKSVIANDVLACQVAAPLKFVTSTSPMPPNNAPIPKSGSAELRCISESYGRRGHPWTVPRPRPDLPHSVVAAVLGFAAITSAEKRRHKAVVWDTGHVSELIMWLYLGVGVCFAAVMLRGRHVALTTPIPEEWSDDAVRDTECWRERQSRQSPLVVIPTAFLGVVALWPVVLLLSGGRVARATSAAFTGRMKQPTRPLFPPPPSYFRSSRDIQNAKAHSPTVE